MINISENVVDKSKHPFYIQQLSFPEDLAVCMLKNMLQPDRPQMTYCKAHTLCMLDKYKATDTNSEYVTLIAFPLQQW
jgi:prenyltransferase beta subunit